MKHGKYQPTVSGYFNPQALEASQTLTAASLKTACENAEQINTMIQNNQTQEALVFWNRVFTPGLRVAQKQLQHTAYLVQQEQKQQIQQQQTSGSGTSTHISLPNDPRELRRLQDTIADRIKQAERATAS